MERDASTKKRETPFFMWHSRSALAFDGRMSCMVLTITAAGCLVPARSSDVITHPCIRMAPGLHFRLRRSLPPGVGGGQRRRDHDNAQRWLRRDGDDL